MKHKYIKPIIESCELECSNHILDGSPINVTPAGEKGGDWNAGAKGDQEDAEFIGWL